ncbi:MAG: GyrI-like domain-containing protein [Candidatus Thorarchaeota archaeon]|nr:GyrI-like domain-containing protein [Candidatus Thorarchaeota archaeon]
MTVAYKKIKDNLVLTHRIHGDVKDLPVVFEKLRGAAGNAADGFPFVVLHYPLTDEKGMTMDVCLPLSKTIHNKDFKVIYLEGGIAATTIHRGPYDTIMDSYRKLVPEVYKHGHPIQENGREEFQNLDLEKPENTVVEIQAMIIDWENRVENHVERVLGKEKKDYALGGFRDLTLETEQPQRASIIRDALEKLNEVATEDQKYEALSRCGHEFPTELIEEMRDLYRATKSIDTVIQAMKEGHYFFPKLRREGRIIYDRKGPARKEAFEKAETRLERQRAICFCPLLKDVWDEMPGTFCYCAAGWPRRLLEGILETPLKIEVTKALTKGDDYCEFAIHLPEGVQ